jgi:nitrous oxide reductase accessory protein NosL
MKRILLALIILSLFAVGCVPQKQTVPTRTTITKYIVTTDCK